MSDDPRVIAYRLQYDRRATFQAWLDEQLTPISNAPAEASRAKTQPIEDFQKEGPHVGERKEIDEANPQRI